jgi:hypothetical protein
MQYPSSSPVSLHAQRYRVYLSRSRQSPALRLLRSAEQQVGGRVDKAQWLRILDLFFDLPLYFSSYCCYYQGTALLNNCCIKGGLVGP